jgi:hypothetical protein
MESNKTFADNEYFLIGMALFVGLYASFTGSTQKLPDFIKNLFNNPIFRVLILSLLLIHNFHSAPHIAITVVLLFTLTMYTINMQEIKENFSYVESFKNSSEDKNRA